jgi:hypothetical protein
VLDPAVPSTSLAEGNLVSDQSDPLIAYPGDHLGRLVRGAVIHHNDLEVDAPLPQHGLQGETETRTAVSRRNDHAHVWHVNPSHR